MGNMIKIFNDMELIQFPRENEKITSMLCFDDCIATYGHFAGVVFEKAYIDSLALDFNMSEGSSIGKSYNYGTKIEDNIRKYCGIEISTYKANGEDCVGRIKECIDKNILVCVEVLGFNCPWDWRYQIIPNGAHYFFINGYDEQERCFNCLDPYYGVRDGSLGFDDLRKGIQSFDLFRNLGISDTHRDIEELIDVISSYEADDLKGKYYRFADSFRSFDVRKEIENYNEETELSTDNIENDIPLNYVFKDIIHNRLRFGTYLRRLADRNPGSGDNLSMFADRFCSLSQKWESARLLMIKYLIVNKTDRISGSLADKLVHIIDEEQDTVSGLLSSLKGRNITNTDWGSKDMSKDSEYVFVDIDPYFNNEGISERKDGVSADLNDKGEYIFSDCFPVNQIYRSDRYAFKIPDKKNGRNDNIQCESQKIKVDADHYDGIQILGCSEWGDYEEELTVVFDDNSVEKTSLMLNDWIPNYLQNGKRDIVIESKKYVSEDLVDEEDCNIFGVLCGIKGKKKVTEIILPECSSMHIFALTLLKNK